MSIADLCRVTANVLDTHRPSRQWNTHAAIDLRRAAREIDRLNAMLAAQEKPDAE